ncbi:MAG: 23S rRNA (adenine(2503)-C(2))-methyltransferase RlmN [Phycisphaerales bacterium]|nr:23S rRNA (adenine(2503)-C(2))-methyltransferase RlmN [Phycisphaerales bacterium]MCI0629188.1 23S rRNA (adenine(2503)-C(2))-methyltransferase RlmN [Phycisphaerales bacterium]
MKHFFDLTLETLTAFCKEQSMQLYVAAQIADWVYKKGVIDPRQMTNLSAAHRDALAESLTFCSGRIVQEQVATDATHKLLIDWNPHLPERGEDSGSRSSLPLAAAAGPDPNKQTECVMIPTQQRKTACISSQIGCPVGCRFCASGIGGLDGNLRSGQIVEQVHYLTKLPDVGRITNVVFMGMGEPLANFSNVTSAIRTLNADWAFGISARKITVSTVGLPAAIRKLVDFELPVTLALSLHAPNDEIRRQLIPWANYATIDELLDACDEYFQKTGREITLEYLLLRGVNDRPEHARELADVAKRLRANVNLIRYNEVRGISFDRPTTTDVLAFQQVLRSNRVNVHVRASRGRDIAAACGQLRHEHRDANVSEASDQRDSRPDSRLIARG